MGLTVIHIFGFEDPEALDLAEKCGIAFQLTNILRDVREDAEKAARLSSCRGFERFGVSPKTFEPADAFRRLMEFEAAACTRLLPRIRAAGGLIDAPAGRRCAR